MKLIFGIIAAAHAKGTHHKLALAGLRNLKAQERELWQRLYLKHAKAFIAGSKAPDNEFKDFKNHVLHVRDDFWGGAPEKARAWYGHLVEALRNQDWATAAWCAGVLSHYVTDPVHPFHTAQSEAENNIHRAVEWSISKSFDDLWRMAEREMPAPSIELAAGDNWLELAICDAATHANANYEKLIAHYDINQGVVDPPSGLDSLARQMCAGLIRHAAELFRAVLERAHADANIQPPDVSLTLEMVVASLQIPITWVTRRLEDAAERRLVERMYDELKATGTVEINLPEDDRVVRDLHRAEVQARRNAVAPAERFPGEPIALDQNVVAWRRRKSAAQDSTAQSPAPPSPARAVAARSATPPARQQATPTAPTRAAALHAVRADPPAPPAQILPPPPLPQGETGPGTPAVAHVPVAARSAQVIRAARPESAVPSIPAERPSAVAAPVPDVVHPAGEPRSPVPGGLEQRLAGARPPTPRRPAGARFYLTGESSLVDAPSIGPKMAERFATFGVRTVAEFMAGDPEATAARLGIRQITADTIKEWQAQAALVMKVPGLRGTHAQLLVGAGLTTPAEIAAVEPDVLCQRVLAFAATADGQRVLRNGDPPDIERIKGWLDAARQVLAA